ncbi:hypothetical protein CAPTEDRAFT_212845 [Capitella teleta]|uniref:Uncharacterized protein n=1 Tax=Capitella teleta TaxID=283909 RepID=R7V4E8_CAPTE|nr:hypothetical protein CAPTEDRAFT_212845 [Capitella teleta]|eukprot:ELU11221.1 hypothetical protein CAPTEDRAFT_212845 [Capitella teleta]
MIRGCVGYPFMINLSEIGVFGGYVESARLFNVWWGIKTQNHTLDGIIILFKRMLKVVNNMECDLSTQAMYLHRMLRMRIQILSWPVQLILPEIHRKCCSALRRRLHGVSMGINVDLRKGVGWSLALLSHRQTVCPLIGGSVGSDDIICGPIAFIVFVDDDLDVCGLFPSQSALIFADVSMVGNLEPHNKDLQEHFVSMSNKIDAFAKALGLALKDPQVRSSLGDIVGESVRQEIIALRAELKRKDATIDDLRRRVVTLETSNDSLEQYQRRNSLRIAGFPEDENEDILTRTLELMNTTMSVEPAITAHDVDRIHRVGKKDGETWLTSNNKDNYDIPDYNSIHSVRTERRGGGVSLFISNKFEFKPRPDLDTFNDDIESLFIEIPTTHLLTEAFKISLKYLKIF